ncbi:Protein of unknown function [Cotesia congregata]|uniref:Cadherin domain-containing protein n=1 Tax=Cotesia congregata TaxID=51543 RepID=A0A8J2HE01_COTCN|nr:Protein of unknown function [Cotesia congregata]
MDTLSLILSHIPDESEPLITTFDKGSNYLLGAELKYQNGQWEVCITKKQDYEVQTMRNYENYEDSLTTILEVIDMPDELPKWARLTASETLKEKSTHTFIVTAVDGDIQINAEINYKIQVLDKVNATIIVIIEDINDHEPEILPEMLSITIKEGKYTTLEFEQPVMITDPDLIQATEVANQSHVGRRIVSIDLENLNDEFPIFENNSLTVSIPEDVENNHYICTMLATDRDVNDTVKYSLKTPSI